MNIQVYQSYPGEYCAVDDDTYDGPGSHIGHGQTKLAAINDLVEQILESLESRIDKLQRASDNPGCAK
jgi:hypothetical protein